jgi:uncharacterized lipoprotein NlpE involved in copper resistance
MFQLTNMKGNKSMKKSSIILVSTFLTLLIGCSQPPSQTTPEEQNTNVESTEEMPKVESPEGMSDTSATSLDWSGTYQGVLPCADCQGIETSLTLNKDMSYLMTMKYLGKDEQVVEQKGTFTWNSEQNTVLLSYTDQAPKTPNQYLVGENMLTQLDMEGNRITGDLADSYVLNKIASSSDTSINLLDTRWKLTELMGQPVESAVEGNEENKDLYIILKTEENKVEGFGGCNNFMGNYEIQEGDRITFSKMVSTKKACANMETETAFFQVLETADSYHFDNSTLMLHKAKMAPLAKFEVVENQ